MMAQEMASKRDSDYYPVISSWRAPMGLYLVEMFFETALIGSKISHGASFPQMSLEGHRKHSVVVYEKTWVVRGEFPWVMLRQTPRVWHKKRARAT